MKPARAIANNFGAKVLAVVVALLVWFNASGQEVVSRVRTVPLLLEGVSDSLALAGPVPVSAELRITATRRQLLALGFQRVAVVADLTGIEAGRRRVVLTGDHVRGTDELDPSSIVVTQPSALEVVLEPLASRRLQVSLATTGALPANVMLEDGGLAIDPAWVTVRGPASIIERIQHVTTETLELARVRETTTRELELECDPRAFGCDPDRVTVTLRVSPRAERILANVPPTVLLDSDDMDAEVEPEAVSLTLEGPASVLDTLSSGDVSVLVSVAGREPASYRVVPDVILPLGVRLMEMSADTLEVRVFRTR
ncbi:MAG TPA: CdaR family protein [Candidatus Krumholzibacteria bacterium]|nr:CdaR family protein [Candidatus Krumholzibacteria bacterium]